MQHRDSMVLKYVLLRREITLKVICEKVKFSKFDFRKIVVTFDEHIFFFRKIFDDVHTYDKGEINTA